MATNLARRIVLSDSPIGMTESFCKAMKERTDAVLSGLKSQLANQFIYTESQSYDSRLDTAIDYVMQKVLSEGVESLGTYIEKASSMFVVKNADLVAMFEDAIMDEGGTGSGGVIQEKILFEDFQKSFLMRLDNINENMEGDILGFADKTSAYVTPKEGRALVEVYSALNPKNKKMMVEALVSSKTGFKKLVEFAMSTVKENGGGGQ